MKASCGGGLMGHLEDLVSPAEGDGKVLEGLEQRDDSPALVTELRAGCRAGD